MPKITLWHRGYAHPDNWPEWLREADIDFCCVEIADGGTVIWHSGVWLAGDWHGGIWRAGVWLDGRWHNGVWLDGSWYGGSWIDGGGVWHSGGPPVYRDEEAAR